MISNFFHIVFYKPLYNGLIGIFNVFPFVDAGVAVILLTIIVKFILFPLSIKATRSQIEMKSIEKDLNDIKEKYKDNKELQAKKIVDLYKEKNINPFSGIFVLLIQLPIIISLYRVFLVSGLPNVTETLLYSFIHIPSYINMNFLGLFDITKKNIILAILSGLVTFLQAKYSQPISKEDDKTKSALSDFSKAMQLQMKFGLPVLMFIISLSLSSAIALYFITSGIFTILQELYIRKHIRKN